MHASAAFINKLVYRYVIDDVKKYDSKKKQEVGERKHTSQL